MINRKHFKRSDQLYKYKICQFSEANKQKMDIKIVARRSLEMFKILLNYPFVKYFKETGTSFNIWLKL